MTQAGCHDTLVWGRRALFLDASGSGCSLRFVAAIHKRHRPAPCIDHHLRSAPDWSGLYGDLGPSWYSCLLWTAWAYRITDTDTSASAASTGLLCALPTLCTAPLLPTCRQLRNQTLAAAAQCTNPSMSRPAKFSLAPSSFRRRTQSWPCHGRLTHRDTGETVGVCPSRGDMFLLDLAGRVGAGTPGPYQLAAVLTVSIMACSKLVVGRSICKFETRLRALPNLCLHAHAR